MKLQTIIAIEPATNPLKYSNTILMLGSCFADEIGGILSDYQFNICINPFGTLYNPCSIANSMERLASGKQFSAADVIECTYGMHDGHRITKYGSFYHHTSCSKETPNEFLNEANKKLATDSLFFKNADTIIITLGTARIFKYLQSNIVVSNCHKMPASEFERQLLSLPECVEVLKNMLFTKEKGTSKIEISNNASVKNEGLIPKYPDKKFIFTVSPIRHLKDGAHGNQISKATLLLAVEAIIKEMNALRCTKSDYITYFPAYEIMMDELRDYRFYNQDMLHPTAQASEYIFERFKENYIASSEYPQMDENLKKTKATRHRAIL